MLDRVLPRVHAYINVSPEGSGGMPVAGSAAEFAAAALRRLGVTIDVDARELEVIPTRGRVLFVANHPYGAIDGLVALALLGAVRPDLKVVANGELCTLRELGPNLVPFEIAGPGRTGRNARATRHALQWLESEGALLMFPAGDVSHFDVRARCVTDPPWGRGVALLARHARVPLVPLHLDGRHGLPFQVASFIHPALRSRLLSRQLRQAARRSVRVRIGAPLPFARLRHFEDEALAAHLRLSTYLLSRAPVTAPAPAPQRAHPVAPLVARADAEGEFARLAADQRLVEDVEHIVLCAPGSAIPHLVDEIGRLRELTARAAGLGTGRARDLDSHDDDHEHLVLWNRTRGEIVAAHRVGHVAGILRRGRRRALAVDEHFRFRAPFFSLSGPTLTLDRSFVRLEQQPASVPALLLWKAVGRYLSRHPRPVRVLGELRIGPDYGETSRQLLLEFLRSHRRDALLGALVRPVHAVMRAPLAQTLAAEVAMLGHVDALAALVADLEPDRKGIPPLLRQYLDFGARFLAVNEGEQGAADCLLAIDLRRPRARALRRGPLDAAATPLLETRT